jgi:hypothetical protein
LFHAYRAAGGRGRLVIVPAFEDDGHKLFILKQGIPVWTARVDPFLRRNGLGGFWRKGKGGQTLDDGDVKD